MKLKKLEKLQNYVNKYKKLLPKVTLNSIESDFEIAFTHESTKIEGNTLSIHEVKTLLLDGISIGGILLREQYEVTNNNKAYNYIKYLIQNKTKFSEDTMKDIHEIIMDNIIQGGIYRNCNVRITGASHTPPDWTHVRDEMKYFINEIEENKSQYHPVKLASWIHAEFVRIHPFVDGNGRTARILMNYFLLDSEYLPISIKDENKAKYYEYLDIYASQKNIKPFYEHVADLEIERLIDYKNEIDKIRRKDMEI